MGQTKRLQKQTSGKLRMKTSMYLGAICLLLVSLTLAEIQSPWQHVQNGNVNELLQIVLNLKAEFKELKNIHEKDANALETLKVQYRNLEKRVETTEAENKYLRKLHTRLESPTTGDLALSNRTRDARAAGPLPAGPIAFYYYLHDPNRQPPHDYTIRFDHKITNVGGPHYDTGTGDFICPKAGVYVFSWSIGEVAHGHIYSELEKNGETMAWAITGDTSYATSTSNTAILHLDTDDRVHVKISYTGNYPTLWEKFSSFSGFSLV